MVNNFHNQRLLSFLRGNNTVSLVGDRQRNCQQMYLKALFPEERSLCRSKLLRSIQGAHHVPLVCHLISCPQEGSCQPSKNTKHIQKLLTLAVQMNIARPQHRPHPHLYLLARTSSSKEMPRARHLLIHLRQKNPASCPWSLRE